MNVKVKVRRGGAAPVQITAEHLIRESVAWQGQDVEGPRVRFESEEELATYILSERERFERAVSSRRTAVGKWIRYAQFEESHGNIDRAVSIHERSLEFNSREPKPWQYYAEMEQRLGNVSRARNIFARATHMLPRESSIWYRAVFFDEILGDFEACRRTFERWMATEPDRRAWHAFIGFERRHGNVERARLLFQRLVVAYPSVSVWLKWARFEEEHASAQFARDVYEQTVEFYETLKVRDDGAALAAAAAEVAGDDAAPASSSAVPVSDDIDDDASKNNDDDASAASASAVASVDGHLERVLTAFAQFEERCGQYERARAIYGYALERLPRVGAQALSRACIRFEKQHGDEQRIDDIVLQRRRMIYERELSAAPRHYDLWFEHVRMAQSARAAALRRAERTVRVLGAPDEAQVAAVAESTHDVRRLFERAVEHVPPAVEKRHWKRYVHLWLRYARFEELQCEDAERARDVLTRCLALVPHKRFSFAKLWLALASLELRARQLGAARRVFGQAIGNAAKPRIFERYVDVERRLGNFERCRTIFERYVQMEPSASRAWISFARFEASLNELERARYVFELAVERPAGSTDVPELLWKAYIDFEARHDVERARNLYRRLLAVAKHHVRVWLSFALFESASGDASRARAIYCDAHERLRDKSRQQRQSKSAATDDDDLVEQRVQLAHAWLDFEREHADDGDERVRHVESLMPTRVQVQRDDGAVAAEWQFADDAVGDAGGAASIAAANMSLLERARLWKQQQSE
jgi:crooked neck